MISIFSASNINFEIYDLKGNRLQLGEDRDDRAIEVSLKSKRVLVGSSNQLMNSSVDAMRKSLQLYAVMVEQAIEINSESFVKNNIDENVIDSFRSKLALIDQKALQQGFFWNKEINRLKT